MAKKGASWLSRMSGEATRHAEFYFDPVEQAQTLEDEGCPPNADYAVLIKNSFVPIEWIPDSGRVLRKFTCGGGNILDSAEIAVLGEYRHELGVGAEELSSAFQAGERTSDVKATARRQRTWPAVGVADSEADMHALLMEQYEALRQNDIAWRCVDSSTYSYRKPNGVYVLVYWFWHGW